MKRLIYQVCLGKAKNSKIYKRCIESVAEYCEKYGIDHKVQTKPILKIKPDVFTTNRSKESYEKHGGFLPIYEKENAFDLLGLDGYDQIAIVDADIFIRPTAPNIFDAFTETSMPFGAVVEGDMPINGQYMAKIKNYSHMQYNPLHSKVKNWEYKNATGFEFMNMGLILLDKSVKYHMKNQNAAQFLGRKEFKKFIDGDGAWKWSTDQTLLNYWLRKDDIPFAKMDWKWNGLYSALQKGKIEECHFVHFFLKDKLPNKGEDVDELMRQI